MVYSMKVTIPAKMEEVFEKNEGEIDREECKSMFSKCVQWLGEYTAD